MLFPSYADVITLNSALLVSASDYDYSNSNLITRLIPPHYLLEAATAEGFETEKADIGDAIVSSTDQPGGGRCDLQDCQTGAERGQGAALGRGQR